MERVWKFQEADFHWDTKPWKWCIVFRCAFYLSTWIKGEIMNPCMAAWGIGISLFVLVAVTCTFHLFKTKLWKSILKGFSFVIEKSIIKLIKVLFQLSVVRHTVYCLYWQVKPSTLIKVCLRAVITIAMRNCLKCFNCNWVLTTTTKTTNTLNTSYWTKIIIPISLV